MLKKVLFLVLFLSCLVNYGYAGEGDFDYSAIKLYDELNHRMSKEESDALWKKAEMKFLSENSDNERSNFFCLSMTEKLEFFFQFPETSKYLLHRTPCNYISDFMKLSPKIKKSLQAEIFGEFYNGNDEMTSTPIKKINPVRTGQKANFHDDNEIISMPASRLSGMSKVVAAFVSIGIVVSSFLSLSEMNEKLGKPYCLEE